MKMQKSFTSVLDMLAAFANVYSIRQSLDIDSIDKTATQDEIVAEIVKRMVFNALDNRGATVSVNNIMRQPDAIDSTTVDYVTVGGLAYGFRFVFSARVDEDEFHAYIARPCPWSAESTLLARLWLDGWTPSEAMSFEYDSLHARLVLEEQAQETDFDIARRDVRRAMSAEREQMLRDIELNTRGYLRDYPFPDDDDDDDEEALGTSPLAALRAKMELPLED